jgi:hypothetical protein
MMGKAGLPPVLRPESRTIAWAVNAAAGRMPVETTCLPQALSTHLLLAAAGVESDLKIGVSRNDTGTLVAHAWVERDRRVVVGNIPDLSSYSVFPSLETVHK